MILKLPLQTTWICTCGQIISKKGAKLSGTSDSHNGLHIHCPKCGKIVVSFVNLKEVQ